MMGLAQKERGWGYARPPSCWSSPCSCRCSSSSACRSSWARSPRPGRWGPLAWVGAAVAVFGILFESIGDFQLVAFKANPANAGKVLQSGLWRYTRHPNYFGDACVWWGLWLIAADTGLGAWSLPGPILLTFLLTRWSGVPTVEGRMRRKRPEYEAYVQRTSGFIPMLPRKV